ncbi:hypothetical protein KKF34_11385 [Myxococcota bacterium]|nr:hypothetical protein [Myxococcota bacterium]MBU1497466.1 hypothetical protein [Myxococcota bacterium]
MYYHKYSDWRVIGMIIGAVAMLVGAAWKMKWEDTSEKKDVPKVESLEKVKQRIREKERQAKQKGIDPADIKPTESNQTGVKTLND